ncbi:MAG: deferrochelatase/peroxidase EfeB [Geodermatophilaceae bacterium]|nr:deferrochelatase/peroxidase EfeB [Geodermatophilaceae bacterium]
MSEETRTAPGSESGPGLTRRRLLGLAGTGTAGVLAGGGAGFLLGDAEAGGRAGSGDRTDPEYGGLAAATEFEGAHQAGIVTPAQDRLHFAAFDIVTDDRAELEAMLQEWTAAARRMTRGQAAGEGGAIPDVPESPPEDTGEALDLPASGLTITVGFGPGMFVGPDGTDRFGLALQKPEALEDLPPFPGDTLRPEISAGDLCIQACAHDPQVAVHAVRNLARIGFGVVSVRWSQLGFGRTSSTSVEQQTPRNLFGFKDGTNNLKAQAGAALEDNVWVQSGDGPEWLTGGSYVVSRRIAMTIETWDRTSLVEQEQIIGRNKREGAPLGTGKEFDPVDLTATSIPENSHIRLANPNSNDGAALLRRGYSFVDGTTELGRLDAGLFFLAYQRDPRTGFIRVQRNLRTDLMNEYIRHTSSAIFACPPGVDGPDDYWGRALFE